MENNPLNYNEYDEIISETHQDQYEIDKSTHIINNNNAVFDFQMGVSSNLLSMGGLHGQNQTSHIAIASERFAQQLDINSIQEQNRFMENGFDATAELNSLFMQSKKHVEEHNYDDIISAYLTFTHGSNLLARDVINSFKCSIIASMKLGDISHVCEAMEFAIPQQGLFRFEERIENVYGDYSEWQKIIQLLTFDDAVVDEYLNSIDSNFGNDHPTIKFVLNSLQQIGADSLNITDALKIYLLTNIKSITSIVAITAFMKDIMPLSFNTNDAAFIFTSYMADCPRFTDFQFSVDIAWFLKNVIINPSFEEKCLHFLETKNAMMKWSQKEAVKANEGRVRLRYRVGLTPNRNQNGISDENLRYNNQSTDSDETINTNIAPASHLSDMQSDSLTGWSLRARIPPAMSQKSRLISYVFMGQTGFANPSNAIHKYCTNDEVLATNILSQKVHKPHADVVIEFLRLLTVKVTDFDELTAFREECFTYFSHTDSKELSPLRILQLYIAIHQNQDLWPFVWKAFCPVISHQVLIAVGNFKKTHDYAMDAVAQICMSIDNASKRTVDNIS